MLIAQTRPFDPLKGELATPTDATGNVVEIATIKGFEAIFFNIVVVILGFAGVALFVMIVKGGFDLMGASGDPQKAEGAKKTITYGIGGFVLLVLSYLIIRFLSTFTGIDLSNFTVFQP